MTDIVLAIIALVIAGMLIVAWFAGEKQGKKDFADLCPDEVEAHPCGPGCSGWDDLHGCVVFPCPWRVNKEEKKDGAA
ncbi:MAG: hypothetical protein JNG85_11820 [Spirochaetaceae bacterium]|nr:hypothetical protein [Spirochaetaceae bacterium]